MRKSKYVDISEDQFQKAFCDAVAALPGISNLHFDKQTAFNMAKGEVTIEASFDYNLSPLKIKGYSGFDRVRDSRYGDALRVIGFIEVTQGPTPTSTDRPSLPGQWRPIGAARKLDGRTFHTKNWERNLRRRVAELFEMLKVRTKDGTFKPTTRDYILAELEEVRDMIRIVRDDEHNLVLQVGGGRWLPPKDFAKVRKVLKALRFRWNPTRKTWYFQWR